MDKLVYTAATGLRAHMQAQAAIANNMANVNTTGFKSDRANFEDLFYRNEVKFELMSQKLSSYFDSNWRTWYEDCVSGVV